MKQDVIVADVENGSSNYDYPYDESAIEVNISNVNSGTDESDDYEGNEDDNVDKKQEPEVNNEKEQQQQTNFVINEKEITKEEEEKTSSCLEHPRIKELYTTADWWSLWIGLLTFSVALILVFTIPYELGDDRVRYVVPEPERWTKNPIDAWDVYNLVGIPILLFILGCFYITSLKFMGKLKIKDGEKSKLKQYIGGFIVMSFLATLSLWFGRNEWASERGLGYAVFAIVLGMFIANTPLSDTLPWLQLAAKDGEFFIKCSLVLLAVELDVLITVGGPGMLVGWIGSPLAIILGFVFGMKLFGCKDTLAMLIAVGASWCGASAISAVAPVISAESEDVALAISVVAFFTVIFTFVQPYIAIAVGMPEDVAGSWIGASVDQTGNVIVSAAIISDEATEIAGIVKMVLNAALGVMASVVACYWNSRRREDGAGKKFKLIMLWDKFPKFTLGFIITSAILTGTMQHIRGTAEEEALPRAISAMNKWWFAIAFVGIGLTTNVRKLWEKAWSSGIIQVYLLANTIDILLALGLSYLAYGYLVE